MIKGGKARRSTLGDADKDASSTKLARARMEERWEVHLTSLALLAAGRVEPWRGLLHFATAAGRNPFRLLKSAVAAFHCGLCALTLFHSPC